MFAKSPDGVIPRTRTEFGVKRIMFAVFFTKKKSFIVKYFPKGQKYNEGMTSSQIFVQSWNEKKEI
jgi:hypothetical protein